MTVRIEKNFQVEAPADAVWELLTDVRRAARFLPGAAITEQVDDSTYCGTIAIKVGPIPTSYDGRLRFDRLDAAERTAELTATGREVGGRGDARARVRGRLLEQSRGSTGVTLVSDVEVTGIFTQFGQGFIEQISDYMFQRFTQGIRQELEGRQAEAAPPGPQAPAPVAAGTAAESAEEPVPLDALAVGAELGGRAARRLAHRRGFWLAVACALAACAWLWLR